MLKEGRGSGRAGARGYEPDLRIDAVAGLVVGCEAVGEDAGRQVIGHACLLAAKKCGHCGSC